MQILKLGYKMSNIKLFLLLLIFATVKLNTAASDTPLPSSYHSVAIDSVNSFSQIA